MTPVEWLASYLKQHERPSAEEIEARAQGLYGNLRPEQQVEIASMITDDVQPTKVCAIILTMILNELVGFRAELSKGVNPSSPPKDLPRQPAYNSPLQSSGTHRAATVEVCPTCRSTGHFSRGGDGPNCPMCGGS